MCWCQVQEEHRQPLRRQVQIVTEVAHLAMQSALLRQLALAKKSRSTLFPFIGRSAQFLAWQHYPGNDAIDTTAAWQFYYHAHESDREGGVRHPREHGHIHLFRRSAKGVLSHLAGLSLDARGIPLTWFACNQWVTGERWRTGADMGRGLHTLTLEVRGPLAGAAKWLADLVRGYARPLQEMLLARDTALATYCQQRQVSSTQAMNDRSIAVWSSFPISWPDDAVALRGQVCTYDNPRRSL